MSRVAENLTKLNAAILVGGLGARLRSVVSDRPKVLAEVRGRPFLAYILDQLANVGIEYVVLCTGYMGQQVRTIFGNSYTGLRLAYSQEPVPLGTAGALRLALPLIKSDPVLVMNGDSVCQGDLSAFWEWHRERGANASIFLAQVPEAQRYGKVLVNAEGSVLFFSEKGKTGAGWVNAGVYLISRALIETIPPGHTISIEREVFPSWIGRGLYGYQSSARFLDIGTPDTYNNAPGFLEHNG